MRLFQAALALALASTAAVAQPPGTETVAVMAFRDLSGKEPALGEALRESVTLDLKNLAGLRVVERAQMDRVLTEQKLAAEVLGADPSSSQRVGKLLGASLLVLGAYQRVGTQVRLTARFVRTETGEVLATAKVDGHARELLTLQDRITAALLRSAGLSAASFEGRARPRLASLEPVELYGRALTEDNEELRRALLRAAVRAAPQLPHAPDQLRALEERLEARAASARQAKEVELRSIEAQLAAPLSLEERSGLWFRRAVLLAALRRFHAALAQWQEAVAVLSTSEAPRASFWLENARLQELSWLERLGNRAALMTKGERVLEELGASPLTATVEQMVRRALQKERARAEGVQRAAAALKALSTERRWNYCDVARVHEREEQLAAAHRLFKVCLRSGMEEREEVLEALVRSSAALGLWSEARGYYERLKEESPVDAEPLRNFMEHGVPVDD